MSDPRIDDSAPLGVAALLDDITDRKGLGDEWNQIDDLLQTEIIAEWQRIFADTLRHYRAYPLSKAEAAVVEAVMMWWANEDGSDPEVGLREVEGCCAALLAERTKHEDKSDG